eukprot:30835-Pelagococcus_subviridis.AAC.19
MSAAAAPAAAAPAPSALSPASSIANTAADAMSTYAAYTAPGSSEPATARSALRRDRTAFSSRSCPRRSPAASTSVVGGSIARNAPGSLCASARSSAECALRASGSTCGPCHRRMSRSKRTAGWS